MSKSIKTFLINAEKDHLNKSANPAIVRASTVYFKSIQEMQKLQKKIGKGIKTNYFDYGRQGSQTSIALQNILKELEQSYHVFLTQTGFAAVALAIMSVCRPGDEIVISDCVYRPTQKLTSQLLKEFNVKTIWYDPNSFDDLKKKVTKKTKLIYVENPGSNSFEFQDLGKIVSFAKRRKIYTAIDNTWGTAYFFKPIKLGFDLSITSATKYYSGHSDVMGGSLAVNKKVFKKVQLAEKITGLRMGPDDAYLVTRGLRTLDVRLDRHQSNAMKVASFLSKHKKIKLLYPFKKGSLNYSLWKKYYKGASGLMGLRIKSSKKNVIKFVNSLKLFGYGYSWGGFESLALHQEIKEQGDRSYLNLSKDEHIVRLHIGLEDPKDLIEDLRRSLKFIK